MPALSCNSRETLSTPVHQNIGFLSHASVSKTIYKGAGPGRTDSMPEPRPLKRRKALGLNARLDRMLSQVNVTHSYSSARRKRIRSSGSSSVSSYDLPRTPVGAYSHLCEDRLGEDFSVLKTSKKALNPSNSPLVQRGPGIRVTTHEKALPSWLANTFSTLEQEHPLRELLPPSLLYEDGIVMEAGIRNDPPQGVGDNDIFAFWPFDAGTPGNNDTSHETPMFPPTANHGDDEFLPCDLPNINAEIQTYHRKTLGFRPFSTPGMLAIPPHTVTSNTTPTLSNPSGSQQIAARINKHLSSNNTSLSASNAIFTSSPILRQTMPEQSISLRQGSFIASNALGPNSLVPDFQEGEVPMNIYSTPGPTFTVSRPVYFDSPTEDPSLSDPLEPESYELDLNALDFQWRPFLRKSLPDHSLTNLPTSGLHASVTSPALFRDSPISGRAIQQTSSPQLNGQSRTSAFASASGVVTSVARDATVPPMILDLAGVRNERVNTQAPQISPHEGNCLLAFQVVSPKSDSAAHRDTESHEHPFTPPRPAQTSQPVTPKKDRQSQLRSTQGPPSQERRTTVSWMLSRRSIAATNTIGHEEVEELSSQRSGTSHDTIESWTNSQ